jgi:hypothetical protein
MGPALESQGMDGLYPSCTLSGKSENVLEEIEKGWHSM